MAPTEDERFSQHTTTVKRLKIPSVFHPPDSLPFVALHIFFVSRHASNISDSGTNCAAVCINLRNQNHCHSDSKDASCQVTSAHFANHQSNINVSKFQILMF